MDYIVLQALLTTVKLKWSCSHNHFFNPCIVIYIESWTLELLEKEDTKEKSRPQPPKNGEKNDLHHSSNLQYTVCVKSFCWFLYFSYCIHRKICFSPPQHHTSPSKWNCVQNSLMPFQNLTFVSDDEHNLQNI